MHSLSRITLIFIVFLALTLSSCFTTNLFPDYWDTPVDKAFQRTESPYPDSPEAVVLFDLEDLSIDTQEWDLIREHHVRIQIFTEEGKEYANIRIPYWYSHTITEIKGQTILPDGRKIPLDKADVYDEGVEKHWRYKVFAMPGVEDQCIIEYQYRYRDPNIGIPDPKYFQGYLHTEYSQFVMTIPKGFAYHATTTNQPPDYSEPEVTDIYLPNGKFQKRYTSEFRNISPVKNEEYMYNREDHLFAMNMQMVSYQDAYNNITFIKEWPDLVEKLLEEYDSYLDGSGALRKLLGTVPKADSTDTPTPRDIYLFVRDQIAADPTYGIHVDEMATIIHNLSGTRVEKNLLAIALLRAAGYTAEPLVISRRSNGRINLSAPSIMDFDHLLVYLDLGDSQQLWDASARYYSYETMPPDNYSGIGLLLIDSEKEKFVEFPAKPPLSQQEVLTTGSLREDGSLHGRFDIKSTGVYASQLRADYQDAKDDLTFAHDELVDHLPGILIDSVTYTLNMDDRQLPAFTTIHFEIPDYFQPSGELLYLPTAYYSKISSNRLTSEERHHAIEFGYPLRAKETINLELPPGYSIVETPKNTSVRGPGLGFQKLCRPLGNQVQLQWNYQLNELVHGPGKYAELKNFFTEVVALDQGVIVLQKTAS